MNQEKYRSLEDGKEQDAFATRLESAIFLFHIDGICGLLRVLMFSHIFTALGKLASSLLRQAPLCQLPRTLGRLQQ
jgi:hypothetical protein